MNRDTVCYRDVNENPCNMCMPMGGILPLKGIEQSMVILHGSQGCSTYMRRHISEHFNEPIDVGSSSLNEKGTIYGGENNLKQALDNIIRVYKPKLVGVLTTCLAETIGEDVERIAAEYLQERGLAGFPIVTAPTPGYGGTHTEGYFYTLKRIVTTLAEKTDKHAKVNIIIPNISPADIRELKRLLQLLDISYTLCPDFADTLDRPLARPYTKIPAGGTTVDDIRAMPGAVATIQLGLTVADELSPGKYLQDEFGVPLYNVPIPTGIENTDRFFRALTEITGQAMPDSVKQERGRLLDAMVDAHKYNFQGRSVIFGEPELVYAVTSTCLENGLYPVVVATGSKTDRLAELLQPALSKCPQEVEILNETDFMQIRIKSEKMGANIAIGHSDGRYLTEKEGIPLVRIGFPIHDRVGGQRLLSVGYTGTALLLDRLTNTLLEAKYSSYRKSMYEKFYRGDVKIS
jgi:nitrogenase molybdenum-iron protein NifN